MKISFLFKMFSHYHQAWQAFQQGPSLKIPNFKNGKNGNSQIVNAFKLDNRIVVEQAGVSLAEERKPENSKILIRLEVVGKTVKPFKLGLKIEATK